MNIERSEKKVRKRSQYRGIHYSNRLIRGWTIWQTKCQNVNLIWKRMKVSESLQGFSCFKNHGLLSVGCWTRQCRRCFARGSGRMLRLSSNCLLRGFRGNQTFDRVSFTYFIYNVNICVAMMYFLFFVTVNSVIYFYYWW